MRDEREAGKFEALVAVAKKRASRREEGQAFREKIQGVDLLIARSNEEGR